MKFKKWPESEKKLLSSEHQQDTIQMFNHELFNPTTSYGESEAKPEKILEWEGLVPTGKAHSRSQQA